MKASILTHRSVMGHYGTPFFIENYMSVMLKCYFATANAQKLSIKQGDFERAVFSALPL